MCSCFCSFDLTCPIPEKDNLIENLNIVLSCLIKNLICFDLECS